VLGLDTSDIERPHDISGPGNKFEWEIMKELALPLGSKNPELRRAIELHDQQYHHRVWIEETEPEKPDDFLFSGTDAICYYRECRWSNRNHDYSEILREFKGNEAQIECVKNLIPRMKKKKVPPFRINNSFPNPGIPDDMYRRMYKKIKETVYMLREKGYALKALKI